MNNITKSPIFISSKTVEKGSELKKEVLKFVDRLGVSVAIQEIFTV
jgi:predicted amino acid-binding ACT domain protein